MINSAPLLGMRGIVKSFPGVQALRGVDLCLLHGEVLALLGENGAGKSTLMKVLGGAHRADAGTVTINGRQFPSAWGKNKKEAEQEAARRALLDLGVLNGAEEAPFAE